MPCLGDAVTVNSSGVAISAACSALLRNGNTSYRHAQRADIEARIVYDRGHNMPHNDAANRPVPAPRRGVRGPGAGPRDPAAEAFASRRR